MSHKDFFRLIVKLFGLYSLIICLFTVIPATLPQLIGFFTFSSGEFWSAAALFWSALLLTISVLVFVLLLFKVDFIIDKLRLDKGFDGEKIIFGDLTSINILKLACIVIGGLLIIDNIPTLLNQGLYLFKESLQHNDNDPKEFWYFGVSAVKIIIGFVLIRNYEAVGKFLRVKQE